MKMIFKEGIVYTEILCYNKKLVEDMGMEADSTDKWELFCFEIENLLAIRASAEEGLAKGKMFVYMKGMVDCYVNIDHNTDNINKLWNYKKECLK